MEKLLGKKVLLFSPLEPVNIIQMVVLQSWKVEGRKYVFMTNVRHKLLSQKYICICLKR